jgi:hypothetical protein
MNRRVARSPDDIEQSLLWAISDPIRHKIIVHLSAQPPASPSSAQRSRAICGSSSMRAWSPAGAPDR